MADRKEYYNKKNSVAGKEQSKNYHAEHYELNKDD